MTMPDVDIVSVFALDGAGGNRVPVTLDAGGMGGDDMQAAARAYGLESVFVLPPGEGVEADYRFRYFVPRHEMEMCGHATIGAVWVMQDKGLLAGETVRIETLSGIVEAFVRDGNVEITQPRGIVEPLPDEAGGPVLDVLGITPDDLASFPLLNARTSRTKTLVPLKHADCLHALAPDFARMEAVCGDIASTGLYPFTVVSAADRLFESRQFPQRAGYPEDPATGIAATAFAFGLLHYGLVEDAGRPVTVHQGRAMGRPSQLVVRFAPEPGGGCFLSGQVIREDP